MTHLVLQFLFDSEDVLKANGMWIFLAVGNPVFVCGLIPALTGAAMLVYVYVLSEPAF
jgi:hypothetical protein